MNAPTLVVLGLSISGANVLLESVLQTKAKFIASSSSPDDSARVSALGVRDVVDRNAGLGTLESSIRKLVEGPIKVLGRDEGLKLLVCDDEDEIRNVLVEFLQTKGYSIHTAQNGYE